jgi:hypothetical protein
VPPTEKQARIASLTLVIILCSINLVHATSEGGYSNDTNPLPNIFEATLTENGYKTNIIVNPDTVGVYSTENGFKLDLSLNPDGIGGLHKEGNYILDLIPYKSFPEQSDLKITNILLCKTIIGQGYLLHINVTVENQVYMPQRIQVFAYTNTTTIQTQTITLTSLQTATITFTWNTTGVTQSNYIISAFIQPAPGEIITADNAETAGKVQVTSPGDVNGDKKVNILDLYTMSKAYGSTPNGLNWNPNTDINCDHTVNNPDLKTVSTNYGKP